MVENEIGQDPYYAYLNPLIQRYSHLGDEVLVTYGEQRQALTERKDAIYGEIIDAVAEDLLDNPETAREHIRLGVALLLDTQRYNPQRLQVAANFYMDVALRETQIVNEHGPIPQPTQ
jgi:hypothetical protein